VLLFQLNRVNYDIQNKKLVKNNGKFEFDKTIYLDLFLNHNKQLSEEYRTKLEKMKEDLKKLKEVRDQYNANNVS